MRRLIMAAVILLVTLGATLSLPGHKVLADQRDFTLVNGSSITIVHVYVSPATVDNWQEDVLGQDVLVSGDRVNITFSGYDSSQCAFDIRVDGKNGEWRAGVSVQGGPLFDHHSHVQRRLIA